MSKYVIKGGNRISGKIEAESAKNAVLPLLAASILTNDQVILEKCPKIKDVLSMINILNALGVKTHFEEDNLVIDPSGTNDYVIPYKLTKELRSSVFMLGSIISRFKIASVSLPGGCDIGLRPINMHIDGLKRLGVKVIELGGKILCDAKNIRSGEVYFDFPSVGATENLMLASVLTQGTTILHNVAKEPEVVDLQNFLNLMGAKVSGAGTNKIIIEGVKSLHGITYKPMFDRIEAGTYLIAASITGGEIEISNCKKEKILSLIHKLCDNTCKIVVKNDIIYLKSGNRRKCFNIETSPYPGFPTDLQAQMTALATVSDGISIIRENIFETRYKHVLELKKMCSDITVKDRICIVSGVNRLVGAVVDAHDLRGGAALVLAGLNAEGVTKVNNICHIERGYFDFDKKLRSLGAEIIKEN